MTDQKQRSIEIRQGEASRAVGRLHNLSQRLGSVDAEIEEEKSRITRQRIQAAKRGDAVAQAADRERLEELRREREELPFEHFAARLHAASTQVVYEEAVRDELAPRLEQARDELGPLLTAAAQATVKADEAADKLAELEGAMLASRTRSSMHEGLIRQIEEEGPRPLYG